MIKTLQQNIGKVLVDKKPKNMEKLELAGKDQNQILDDLQVKISKQYDPYQYPPDLDMALNHHQAKRVAFPTYMVEDSQNPLDEAIDFCDCCGLPIDNIEISLNADRNELYFLGPGYPLFFQFIYYSIWMLLFMFICGGIFNFIVNVKDFDKKIVGKNKIHTLLLKTSQLTRWDNSGWNQMQHLLDFLTVIVCLAFLQYFRYRQRATAFYCDAQLITAAEYTIMISNIPNDAENDEIKDFFEQKMKEFGIYVNVMKINRSYYISDYIEALRVKMKNVIEKREVEKQLANKEEEYNDTQEFFKKAQINIQIKQLKNKIQKEQDDIVESNKVLQDIIENMDERCPFTGTAFVTLENTKQASQVKGLFKLSPLNYLSIMFQKYTPKTKLGEQHFLKSNIVYISRAPEPSDILWENLGFSWQQRLMRRLYTSLITVLILIGSFLLIFGINYLKKNILVFDKKQKFIEIVLKFLASLVTIMINFYLNDAIRTASSTEKQLCYTEFDTSVAEKKVFSVFFNTAIVNFIIFYITYKKNLYDGMIDLVFSLFFIYSTNLIAQVFNGILNVMYFLKLFQRYLLQKQPQKSFMIQQEAHKLFEDPPMNIPNCYANILNMMLYGAFYAPLFPLTLPFSIITLILYYWMYKYILLRRSSLPNIMGKEISYAMVEYAEYVPLAYASGSLIFGILIHNNVSGLMIAAIVICCLNFILPMKMINKKIFPLTEKAILLEKNPSYNINFNKARIQFSMEYDRINPITQKEATEEWLQYLQQKEDEDEEFDQDYDQEISAEFNLGDPAHLLSSKTIQGSRQFTKRMTKADKQQLTQKAKLFGDLVMNNPVSSDQEIMSFKKDLFCGKENDEHSDPKKKKAQLLLQNNCLENYAAMHKDLNTYVNKQDNKRIAKHPQNDLVHNMMGNDKCPIRRAFNQKLMAAKNKKQQ